jgi:hypothetical protein
MVTNNTIQGTKALAIFPSDNADIPTPNLQVSSTMTGKADGGAILVDSTNPFIVNGSNTVNVGDVIYVPSLFVAATVIEVISASQIRLNDPIADAALEYQIYQQSQVTGNSNSGCFIYVGTTAGEDQTVTVKTASNDYIVFHGVVEGSVLPVKVKAVYSTNTSCSNLVAIW